MSTVTLDNKTILVTGAAGFIGSNLVKRIYQEAPSATVIGIDNMNAYYDVALKEFRLNELAKYPTFTFVKGNIADKELITELFEKYNQEQYPDNLPTNDEITERQTSYNNMLSAIIDLLDGAKYLWEGDTSHE